MRGQTRPFRWKCSFCKRLNISLERPCCNGCGMINLWRVDYDRMQGRLRAQQKRWEFWNPVE